jgi:hypothetical protein
MQGPTHLVTGILIQKSLERIRPTPLQYLAVAALGVLSHGILDHLARATYHPPAPLTQDWFWVISHLTIGILTLCVIVRYWRGYKFGMFCSILPDLDWVVRPVANFFSMGFGQRSPLHTLLNRFIDLLVPPKIWDVLPNWNLARKGLVVEVVLFAILLACIYALGKRARGVA